VLNEVEQIWQEDIKAKKQNSIFPTASKKGMRTPYDYMTNKEKKNLNGKVEVTNMYDLLLNKEEFEAFPEAKQTEILTHWRTIYPNAKIMESLGIHSPGVLNALIEKLNVPKKNTWKRTKRTAKQKEVQAQIHSSAPVTSSHREKIEMDNFSIDGFSINYHGSYTSEQLSKIWTKLQLLTDGEENSFTVSITVQEKKE